MDRKPITPDEYNAVVEDWKELQSYPWSKLLYTVSRSNLERHIHRKPLRVLDVGGGNGFNSVYFAQQGHTVTLLDYSPVMLVEARQAAEQAGVLEQITFLQADAGMIEQALEGQEFDLILCHLMIEFVPEPIDVLKQVCNRLAPEGLLSVLDANRYSEVYRKAIQANDLAAALDAVDATLYFHPWFNRMTPIFSSAEMSDILRSNGCEVVGDYGVRCINDYLPNELKYVPESYQALEKLELRLTDRHPYKLLARCYQVIVKKAA